MRTAGAPAACGECIPTGTAAAVEIFRLIAWRTDPAMIRPWPPLAERAADAAEVGGV